MHKIFNRQQVPIGWQMSAIGKLEESQASLRLLITLYQTKHPLMHGELTQEMKERYNLGRRTVETAVDVCIALGLVNREKKRVGNNPMPSLFHTLTEKGKKIAELALQMNAVLS
jgi:DNA-binding MarR family transcriptional regulator